METTKNTYKNLPMDVTGKFTVVVGNILHRSKEKSKEKLIWQLEITEGIHDGLNLAKYSNYHTDKGWVQLQSDLDKFGLQVESRDDIDQVLDNLPGRELLVEVKLIEVDGNEYRSVSIIEDRNITFPGATQAIDSVPLPEGTDTERNFSEMVSMNVSSCNLLEQLNEVCMAIHNFWQTVQLLNTEQSMSN